VNVGFELNTSFGFGATNAVDGLKTILRNGVYGQFARLSEAILVR